MSARASDAPRPFKFGADAKRPTAALAALDRMSEHMTRRLRDVLEPMARTKPRVEAEPVAVRRYEEWRSEQPDFTSLGLYRFPPLKGGMMLAIEPRLVRELVDAFYGGPGTCGEPKVREFTATEEQLLARLSEAVVQVLSEVWSEVMTVKPKLSARETNAAHALLVGSDEPVAAAHFSIALAGGRPCNLEILYPVSSIRAVETELSARTHEEGSSTAAAWRDRLEHALGDVRLQARSVLARPTISVSELLRLSPGDVIPISVPTLVPLLVAGRSVAVGRIGDHDGRAALKIERVEDKGAVH